MGFGDLWNRTLVYFGIAEEDEWDDDYAATEELERSYQERPANVRRLASRRQQDSDDWTSSSAERTEVLRPARLRRVDAPPAALPGPGGAPATVHLVIPRSFNDAQQIADKFKELIPVILNLQSSDAELSKRLIDFASGLTYALDGGMQRVADKVFLLTPRNVEVSAEERARWLERGGFFNQA
jgi:cell division inhibitor SepF